jgi:hypothetical protein
MREKEFGQEQQKLGEHRVMNGASIPIEQVLADIELKRTSQLEFVKDSITLKLQYEITKKLALEREQIEQLKIGSSKKKARADLFTNILDEHYFEQKLFTAQTHI